MLGKIVVDTSFKHKTQEPIDIGMYGYKSDFFLIPKGGEEVFLKSIQIVEKPPVIHPRDFPFPPLWQELIKRDKAAEGVQPTPKDFLCPAVYDDPTTVVAKEGEKPSFLFTEFKPVTPHLYENLKLKN
ncbi:unnamed protein product [Allacma fusca]|uniref:Uncharacterized protein n=1 Tax=Allacma fusca TaxID=39272 RepID=A0A8J2PFQ0_9HEXA|nr:unnamed protein product [Allacma fusca]